MGLFSKKKPVYPELNSSDQVANLFNSRVDMVKSVLSNYDDDLEVVPSNDTTFYYIGNPPKMFGFAWDDGSKVTELKNVIKEKEWVPMRVEMIIKDLRAAYEKYQDDSKYSTVVENKKITVVDSSNFVDNLKEILSHIEK